MFVKEFIEGSTMVWKGLIEVFRILDFGLKWKDELTRGRNYRNQE